MNMFVIASKSNAGNYLNHYHPRIYANQKQAENALKVMKSNGKLTESSKVYGLNGLHLVDL
ncbi:hypothetical protein [Bacillus sp. MZGC1]|uniref:hypothetical protein n=1 Tax=Bacillus sp. MZGC1 TaxID=2108543 RepID=UPI000D02EAB5|nr:hypothetical protein [Bacillus sp. MZGC1]PRS47572.1 hypothetical protein C6Y06_18670 [Bacillus sp. MZGC1]